MNINLFSKIDKFIFDYENYNTQQEIQNDECNHNFKDIEGLMTCVCCGLVKHFIFEEGEIIFKNTKKFIKYTPKIHIKDIINRLSGFMFKEKKSDYEIKKQLDKKKNQNIKTIKQIRQYIKQNNLYPKNDFYLYKYANKIEVNISNDDKRIYVREFLNLKQKMSLRDYFYNKFKDHPKYYPFATLFERKTKKKNKRTKKID